MGSSFSFNMKWPQSFDSILNTVSQTSQSQDMFLSYDCFIKSTFPIFGSSFFIFKVFLSSFIPLLLAVVLLLMGLIAKGIFRKWLSYKRLVVISLITIFFNLYSGTSSNIINLFNCKTIEEDSLLTRDLTVTCWKSSHLIWSLAFGVPFMIFWVFGLPFFGIGFLFFNKKKVGSDNFNNYFILLY